MKNKTLLEAATDMLLNRPETTVSENISPSVLENLDLLALNTVLKSATDALYDKYVDPEENDNEDIEYGFRALKDDIDNLHDLIHERQIGKPKVKGDEALDLTGAVLEEISARCESITKLCDNILRDSYTDFNSTITNFSESADEEDLKEGTEMDDIAAAVAELKVGDKTNFGVVVALGGNSVTFKGKDLPKTKITFNQRKMGSRDYVLSALRKIA
jgi:hypothetical protein